MTKKELKQVYYIDREIKMWQRKLDELNNKSPVGTPELTGMPRGAGSQNKIEDEAIEKAEMSTIIAGLLVKLQRQKREIMEYITSIEDSFIRQIMICRYVNLMSWTRIAMEIGGGNTPDSVRMAHDRFLRKN